MNDLLLSPTTDLVDPWSGFARGMVQEQPGKTPVGSRRQLACRPGAHGTLTHSGGCMSKVATCQVPGAFPASWGGGRPVSQGIWLRFHLLPDWGPAFAATATKASSLCLPPWGPRVAAGLGKRLQTQPETTPHSLTPATSLP